MKVRRSMLGAAVLAVLAVAAPATAQTETLSMECQEKVAEAAYLTAMDYLSGRLDAL